MQSLYSIQDLSAEKIMALIKRSFEFKNNQNIKINKSIANIFLEPSTRTMISFQKAQNNLGMEVYNVDINNSSFQKGESLEDTLLNLNAIGIDHFVIRTSDENYWSNFNHNFSIVNAGDGTKNHPTQALLDAMTIYEHFQTLNNLKVMIIGDIIHSRVYHSNKMLLEKFNSSVDFLGPKDLSDINQKLQDVIGGYDVVIFLRIQHERHTHKFDISDYNNVYGLNENIIKLLKPNSIFMHPGPVNQGVEITKEILYKENNQNKILQQVKNGVFVRMAILEEICKNS